MNTGIYEPPFLKTENKYTPDGKCSAITSISHTKIIETHSLFFNITYLRFPAASACEITKEIRIKTGNTIVKHSSLLVRLSGKYWIRNPARGRFYVTRVRIPSFLASFWFCVGFLSERIYKDFVEGDGFGSYLFILFSWYFFVIYSFILNTQSVSLSI